MVVVSPGAGARVVAGCPALAAFAAIFTCRFARIVGGVLGGSISHERSGGDSDVLRFTLPATTSSLPRAALMAGDLPRGPGRGNGERDVS